MPVPGIRQASAGRKATGGNRSGSELQRSGQRGSQGAGTDLERTRIARAIDGADAGGDARTDFALRRERDPTAWKRNRPRAGTAALGEAAAEWLEIEKSRDSFTVQATEQERLVSLGGLQVRTRADRVDELPNGREIILDYKTGMVKSTGWEGDRPDEPQLPLYCATSDEPIAGAAFALIRIGELGFRGGTEEGVSLPALKGCARRRLDHSTSRWKNGGAS